ncbi:MAG: tRNA (adenosine(37)-N6)-threonylcarbamoyltransferase complex ATPase subunit type 1 TsaE [Candidatus Bostrichicola ureolyticus]|nr:MAG: tRNA (adenosine(37)-N6)-threonylcarbamoyltransferase complex ATPase subunit type 1 TsaE [Candidatus Bostrichicola ureolyticus]
MLFYIKKKNNLLQVGNYISQYYYHNIIAFYGSMGSGKTTLISYICKCLGSTNLVNSPTFSIVNEYLSNEIGKIYHFDFYRIENEYEIYDLGYEEYFYSKNICLIEWPDKYEHILPINYHKVIINKNGIIRKIKFI